VSRQQFIIIDFMVSTKNVLVGNSNCYYLIEMSHPKKGITILLPSLLMIKISAPI